MAKAKTNDTVATAPEKIKVKKPQFDLGSAVDASGGLLKLNEDKRLVAAPSNWESKFAPLGRQNFGTRAIYLEWKLVEFDKATAARGERREELVGNITEAKEGVNPTKKKVNKLKKLQKQLAALQAQLKEEGIDI